MHINVLLLIVIIIFMQYYISGQIIHTFLGLTVMPHLSQWYPGRLHDGDKMTQHNRIDALVRCKLESTDSSAWHIRTISSIEVSIDFSMQAGSGSLQNTIHCLFH